MKAVKRILRSLVVIYLGVSVGACLIQRSLVYHPSDEDVAPPPAALYPGFEDIEITTTDGVVIRAWYWPTSTATTTILLFHGNGGNRGGRLGAMRELHERGYGVLAPDYRGYGGSEGDPSEDGLRLDAIAARTWLTTRGILDVVYLGESLGTGVAVDLAVLYPPTALILQSPFDSLVSAAGHHFPFLPVGWLLWDRYDSIEKIERVTCPILFIHGERDEVVPYDLGRQLYDRAPEPKRWIGEPAAGHNDILAKMGARYYDEIVRFLRADGR